MTMTEAMESAEVLDNRYSAVGIQVDDKDGYYDNVASANNWFIEFDDTITSDRIFGKSWGEIQSMQQGNKE